MMDACCMATADNCSDINMRAGNKLSSQKIDVIQTFIAVNSLVKCRARRGVVPALSPMPGVNHSAVSVATTVAEHGIQAGSKSKPILSGQSPANGGGKGAAE